MGEVLIPTLLGLVKSFRLPLLHKAASNQDTEASTGPDLNVLNCRVRLTRHEKVKSGFDAFTVEIRGSIHAPSDMHHTTLRVSIADITDGISEAKPVHSRIKQWQTDDSPLFCYNTDLGKLPNQVTTLSDWTAVAQLNLDWLILPHKGKRSLQFTTLILSHDSGKELARTKCTFIYENVAIGYIDLKENIQHAKTLAVALAFAVSAADSKLFKCEVELIKNWARDNIDIPQVSDNPRRKLEKALNKTVSFFRKGNQLDAHKICREIVEIAPLGTRYDILDLCLRVARASGTAAPEELALLKNLAVWLEVDTARFQAMMEKILPIGIHQVKNAEVFLGVTSDMSREKTQQHLNSEYRKWNSRVTNFNPEIQRQADQMLKLIAEARSEYIG
jgi:tellurite resistance protein